ncbi:MAG: hypothetical protein VW776_03720 [Betaproteobacteria bacterium]|jgi:hypothetical protein
MESPAQLTNQVAHLYYELEALVDANKLRAYTNRLRIAENSSVALQLATASFNENRQLINDASTAIVRSKKVMVQHQALEAGLSNEAARDLVDQAELEYLDRRSSINKAVLDINNRLSSINVELIGLIKEIVARNDELLQSNEENLQVFNEMVQNFDVYLSKFPELDTLSDKNDTVHQQVFERANANAESLERVYFSAEENRSALDGLRETIARQRTQISNQWIQIEAQQELCFELISEN